MKVTKCLLGCDPLWLGVRTCWLIFAVGQFVTCLSSLVFRKMPFIHVHTQGAHSKLTRLLCTYAAPCCWPQHFCYGNIRKLKQCRGSVLVCLSEISLTAFNLALMNVVKLIATRFHWDIFYIILYNWSLETGNFTFVNFKLWKVGETRGNPDHFSHAQFSHVLVQPQHVVDNSPNGYSIPSMFVSGHHHQHDEKSFHQHFLLPMNTAAYSLSHY